jgi:hypothetical protein
VVPIAAPGGAVRPIIALVPVIELADPIVGGLILVKAEMAKVGIDVPFTFVAVKLNLYRVFDVRPDATMVVAG